MEVSHKPRATRLPWTETEDRLLYYWLEHIKSNHLSSKAIGIEMAKEVEFLKSLDDPSLSFPVPARKYTDNAIKNRINKMKEGKLIFHPLPPRNPDRRIAEDEVSVNGLGLDTLCFSVPTTGPRFQEVPLEDTSFGMLVPPGGQIPQYDMLLRQPADEMGNFDEYQEDFFRPTETGEYQVACNPTHNSFMEDYDAWLALQPLRDYLGYPNSINFPVNPNPHMNTAATVVSEADRISPEIRSIEATLQRARMHHEVDKLPEELGWWAPPQEPSPWREFPQL